ncbi:MAG: hypothetical protein EBT47_02855, partial [Chloroflexi bacterium]|nr:hypothetical protein [Chloroflexota bacterium]
MDACHQVQILREPSPGRIARGIWHDPRRQACIESGYRQRGDAWNGTQTAVKNGDTLTFGGTIGGTSPSIQGATLRQYSDTGATTEITGAAITLTLGTDISASGTTISGTKAVAFNANAVRVKLEVVVLDSSDASTQTGT